MKKSATNLICTTGTKSSIGKITGSFRILMLLLFSVLFSLSSSFAQQFSVDFRQAANDDNTPQNDYPPPSIHWINGILQNSNSRYAEGMSTLQRVVLTDLQNCNASNRHILRVKFETQKSAVHAYDFITGWNQALGATETIAPGLNLMPPANYGGGDGIFDLDNDNANYSALLNRCGDEISATAETACNAANVIRDLPVIFSEPSNPLGPGESNLNVGDDINTTRNVIANYESRYGARTVRVRTASGFTGAANDAFNRVVFAGYGDTDPGDGGTNHIFYDIMWTSAATSVVIEFAAHIAVGVDGIDQDIPGGTFGDGYFGLGVGYEIGNGASNISGGPYHVILVGFINPAGGNACEGNMGNQDNQLQGSEVLLVPHCELSGPPTVCSGGDNVTYTAIVSNTDNPTYVWSVINSGTNASIVSGQGTSGPLVVDPGTQAGQYTVRLVVTNDGELSSTCETTTQVICPTPTIGGQGANSTIECTASPSFTPPTANDACGGASVQIVSTNTTGNSCVRVITRTWRAVNSCGNSSGTVAQSITVVDTQAPIIGNAGANATIECTASPSFQAPTASDACNTYTVVQLTPDQSSGNSCLRTVTRVWRAVDACGNSSATRSQTITIRDTQAPTIGGQGANTTINCTGTPSFTPPTSSDVCNTSSVVEVGSQTIGTCTQVITKTWRAVDACGNSSGTVAQTITVIDNTPPLIGGQGANTTIECTASPNFTPPTTSDACNTSSVVLLGENSSGNSCLRTVTRTWRAVDACGNSSGTVAQTITIRDTQAPVIGSAGANTTIECTASPSFQAPTASDACNTYTVVLVSSETSGNSCLRTITRVWRAVDECGNSSATRSQVVTIRDSQAPVIGSAGANTTIECTASPSFQAPTASDACNTYTVVLVSSETSGNSCLRTITRVWRAVDECGNSSATRSQVVTIRDSQAPVIGDAGANATIVCPNTPAFTPPTAADACNTSTVVQLGPDITAGTCITRTWIAVDACGNSSATRAQTICVTCFDYFCTYTQGAYGSANGSQCDGTNSYPTTTALLTAILDNGAPLVIGRPGNNQSITFPNTAAGVAAVIEFMPGGGSPDELRAGNCTATYPPVPACIDPYLHGGTPGTFDNVFIGQTVALMLNTRLQGGALLNLVLQPGWLVTQSRTGCGEASVTLSCAAGGDIISKQMNSSVIDFLTCYYGSPTVANLIELANDLLGGVLTPGQSVACGGGGNGTVPSYSAVSGMEGALNEGFDECRTLLGFYHCSANCSNFDGGANNPPAIVNAGPDQNIGLALTAQLAGSVSGGAATGTWSGGTTASFNPNRTTLNAVYTPTAPERTAGTLVLTLTADPAGPCPAVSDQMTITMVPIPTINSNYTTLQMENTGYVEGKLTLSTYPNPFKDRVKFLFTSPVSGQATLEVYNMVGQRIQTVYEGEVRAGVTQIAEYRSRSNGALIYKLKVGDKFITGKLININQ